MKRNHFGNEKTNLQLTNKAFEVYSNSTFEIFENDDGTYDVDGYFSNATEQEVNEFLEMFTEDDEEA